MELWSRSSACSVQFTDLQERTIEADTFAEEVLTSV
jgi:hypothetical protein